MTNHRAVEDIPSYVFLGMTAVTGLVDAVSLLSLGRVFTANMTGNVVFLAFATARVSEPSIALSVTALGSFLTGAMLGGRIMARGSAESYMRFAAQAFLLEVVALTVAALWAIGYQGESTEPLRRLALIALTALAMGTRNAAFRKLAIPDVTTTVLTLTLTGIAADSSLANGNNVRLARRIGAVLALFSGAAVGAVVIGYSTAAALGLAASISALCSLAWCRSLRRSQELCRTPSPRS
jgi:uncharacterized membrane protein YoaK (UPF0700 family)